MVPAWYSATVKGPRPQLRPCLLAGAASRKRICCGRGHIGRPEVPSFGQRALPDQGHVLPRCAAIRSCHRCHSARTANPETKCVGREISLRKIRSATVKRRRCSTDNQRLSSDGSAGISNCGILGRRVGSSGFSISPDWLDPETRKEADSMKARYNENPEE